MAQKPLKYSNLLKGGLKTLWDLQKKDVIVIVNADRGGSVIIINAVYYIKQKGETLTLIKQCSKQWNSQQCYRNFTKGKSD